MIKINEAIIVEGVYDKKKLSTIIDTTIISTEGFRIFKDSENLALIKRVAQKNKIVILTDSDRAGFVIRNFLKGCIPADLIKHAYIPNIKGKERRKAAPSKEGILGVEGVDNSIIIRALEMAGCSINEAPTSRKITKQDFFDDGLSGKQDSAIIRRRLSELASLPTRLSSAALIDVLNTLYTYEEYKALINKLGLINS